jgi:hypothetical protein
MSIFSKRLWQWCGTPEGRAFIALLSLALLIRLVLAPFFGFYPDLQDYVNWGLVFDQHPLSFYALTSNAPTYDLPNYPPLMIYLCGLLTGSYFGAARLLGIQAPSLVSQAPQLVAWMKLPTIVFDLGTITVLYALARRAFPGKGALLITASYAFSPAILCDGVFWGQTDGIPVLLILLALLCTLGSSGIWAGVFFALAITFNLQSVIFVPLFLLYLWRWAGLKQALRAISSLGVVGVAICSPYLLPPSPGMLAFYGILKNWAAASHGSENAFNLWFLLAPRQDPSRPYFAFFSPTSLGLLLFFAILLLVLIGIWKDRSAQMLFFGAALTTVAFFVVTTLQHERYLYPTVALALAAALAAKRNWLFYVAPGITLFVNLLVVLLINGPYNFGLSRDFAYQWNDAVIGVSLAIALVNIWLLGRMVVTYLRSVRNVPAANAASAATAHSYAANLEE